MDLTSPISLCYNRSMNPCAICKTRGRSSNSYCLPCNNLYKKRWYHAHPERARVAREKYNARLRLAVIHTLGGECKHCGIKDMRVLQIDHIHGRGHQEREAIGFIGIRRKILKGNIKDYQLLCANCNWIKRAENKEVGHQTRPYRARRSLDNNHITSSSSMGHTLTPLLSIA